jgi:hypothetical protein
VRVHLDTTGFMPIGTSVLTYLGIHVEDTIENVTVVEVKAEVPTGIKPVVSAGGAAGL